MVKYNYSRKEGGIVLIYYIKNMKLANEWKDYKILDMAYVLKPGKKVWIQYFGNYGRTYVIGKSLKYCTFREGTNWFKPLH